MSSEHDSPEKQEPASSRSGAGTTRALTITPEQDGRRRLAVTEVVIPQRAPHQALVRMAYGGICGSDLHYWQHGAAGVSVLKHPMVLGHEVVGTVLEAAADGSGPRAGQRVAVHPARRGEVSGIRYPQDRPNLSPAGTYLGSAAHDPHTDGAFAQEAVFDADMLRVLPDGLDLRTAAVAEPAAVAWHAVRRAGEIRGRHVAVVGCGPIGALAIAVLVRAGAGRITAVDLHSSALERARQLGADELLQAPSAQEAEAVQADVVVESSGSWQGMDTALHATVRGGRVVMVGMLPPGQQPVDLSVAIARELEMVGCFRFHDELDEVLAALADGSLQTGPVVTHVLPFDRAEEAFDLARRAQDSGKVLLEF